MKSILVHTCCAPCAAYCFEKLAQDGYEVTGYFYNPNIQPEPEYEKRKNELEKLSHKVVIEETPPQTWFDAVKGLEYEKEGGKRCEICFLMRLEKTALYALEQGFQAFSTVLTVSPHKNSQVINKLGKAVGEKYGIVFLEENFKKNEGFKKTMEIAKKQGFFRQNYCGCVYSMRE